MTAYFSIRFAVFRSSSTLEEKLGALSELARMPNWAKVECLPAVVLLVRAGSSQLAEAAQAAVFESLLARLPASRRKGFREVINGFGSSDIATALQDLNLATRFAANETRRDVEHLGVFSIEHNIDVTLALAILTALAIENSDQTREFLDQSTIQGAWNNVAEVLDRAHSLAFGRHQCLLRWTAYRGWASSAERTRRLEFCTSRDVDSLQILSEPDRLFRYCRLAQLNSDSKVSVWAREELTTYPALRRLPGNPVAVSTPAMRLRTLAVWQEAVLQIALISVGSDASEEIGRALGPLFQPRVAAVLSRPKRTSARSFRERCKREFGPAISRSATKRSGRDD